MAFKILREAQPQKITRAQLKDFSEERVSASPLRPLVGTDIKVKFTDNEPNITFTAYERDGKRADNQKFVEVETDKGWLPLNCFKSKQLLDFKSSEAEMIVNEGVGKFTDDPITVFDKIQKNGKNAVYRVSALPYIGKTNEGRLYPATSYVVASK